MRGSPHVESRACHVRRRGRGWALWITLTGSVFWPNGGEDEPLFGRFVVPNRFPQIEYLTTYLGETNRFTRIIIPVTYSRINENLFLAQDHSFVISIINYDSSSAGRLIRANWHALDFSLPCRILKSWQLSVDFGKDGRRNHRGFEAGAASFIDPDDRDRNTILAHGPVNYTFADLIDAEARKAHPGTLGMYRLDRGFGGALGSGDGGFHIAGLFPRGGVKTDGGNPQSDSRDGQDSGKESQPKNEVGNGIVRSSLPEAFRAGAIVFINGVIAGAALFAGAVMILMRRRFCGVIILLCGIYLTVLSPGFPRLAGGVACCDPLGCEGGSGIGWAFASITRRESRETATRSPQG